MKPPKEQKKSKNATSKSLLRLLLREIAPNLVGLNASSGLISMKKSFCIVRVEMNYFDDSCRRSKVNITISH